MRVDADAAGVLATDLQSVVPAAASGPLQAAAFTERAAPGARRAGDRRVGVWLAIVWLGLVVAAAVLADLLPLQRYDRIVNDLRPRLAPRLSIDEPFGTDSLGRSVTSRLIFGARQSLIVAVVSTVIAMSAGCLIGITAGYFRGVVDRVVSVVVDAVLAIPALVLLLAIASVGKRSLITVVVALGLVGMPTFVRLARAKALALGGQEYVTAARAMGATHRRIVMRELLPSVVLPVSTYGFLFLGFVTVVEATLSFLGLGVPPPSPSWGGMVNDARPFLESDPALVFVPAACILFTVLSFSVLGDHARRRVEGPRSKR